MKRPSEHETEFIMNLEERKTWYNRQLRLESLIMGSKVTSEVIGGCLEAEEALKVLLIEGVPKVEARELLEQR